MKVKQPKSKVATSKSEKLRSKTMKKKVKKSTGSNISVKTLESSKDDIKKKRKDRTPTAECLTEGSKKKEGLKQKLSDDTTALPSKRQTSNDKKHRHIKKKKTFNKEAIEKMKAHQLVKKEKLMRKNSLAPPPTPDAKRRRPKLPVRLEAVDIKFSEDDDTMTQFEGMWVPREETGRLQSAREDLERRGLPAERINRRMKQLVRREHRKLKIRLIAAQTKTERVARERRQFMEAQQTPRVRRRVPGRSCGLTLQENERLARFDGFWVSAEAVPRLEALRQQLVDQGKTENEARRLLRKARRVEERKVKSCGRLLCTKCGGRGHLLSDCTAQAVTAAGGTACFRCGATGHRLSDCPRKGDVAGLPFATCFLCKQQGHMSRECPQAEAADDARQKSTKTKSFAPSGQSWRGLTHDADDTAAERSVQTAPPSVSAVPAIQKPRVHIRFD